MADPAPTPITVDPTPPLTASVPASVPSLDDAGLKSLSGNLADIKKRESAERETRLGDMDAAWSQWKGRMGEAFKRETASREDIKPWNAELEQAKHQTNVWEAFGSPGFLVAMLGSAFSAMPMNSALQAGGAAITALNQNNNKEYERAFEAWQQNTELAIKRHAMEHQELEDIYQIASKDMEQGIVRLKEHMLKYDDQRGLALLEAGLLPEYWQAKEAEAKAMAAIPAAQREVMENKAIIEAVDAKAKLPGYNRFRALVETTAEWTAAKHHFSAGDFKAIAIQEKMAEHAGDPSYKTADAIRDVDEEIASGKLGARYGGKAGIAKIAEGIEKGRQPPVLTSLYGAAAPVRAQLEADGFDLTKAQLEYTAAQRHIASLNGPQITRFIALANSVQGTIGEVKKLSEEMKLSGVPALNKLEIQAYIQAQGNSPNGKLATRYVAAVNTLKEEFANLATGGYAPTEPAWELANQQINGNYGVGQLGAALDEVDRLIGYRLMGLTDTAPIGTGAANRYIEGKPAGHAAPDTDPLGLR